LPQRQEKEHVQSVLCARGPHRRAGTRSGTHTHASTARGGNPLRPELCKYGVVHKRQRNLRRHLDAVIPPYAVFSYDLRRNLLFYRNIWTVLQNIMTASTVRCTSLFETHSVLGVLGSRDCCGEIRVGWLDSDAVRTACTVAYIWPCVKHARRRDWPGHARRRGRSRHTHGSFQQTVLSWGLSRVQGGRRHAKTRREDYTAVCQLSLHQSARCPSKGALYNAGGQVRCRRPAPGRACSWSMKLSSSSLTPPSADSATSRSTLPP